MRPRLGMHGPTRETLAWWDRLNVAGKRTFGVGGVDAHAIKQRAPWGEVEIFSYKWTFGTLTNYLLLDAPLAPDAPSAINQVYGALANGQLYFVNRYDGGCPALIFHAEQSAARWASGASPSLRDGALTIVADAGRGIPMYKGAAQLRLIHNGRVIAAARRALRYQLREPGVYRLEGYRKGRPWLFTNPIYVTQ